MRFTAAADAAAVSGAVSALKEEEKSWSASKNGSLFPSVCFAT